MNWQWFTPAAKELFYKSQKSGDPRFGDKVISGDHAQVQAAGYCLAGYPDDEGIVINGGRPGAAQGPDGIRRFFYKTTPSLHTTDRPLYDFGNLNLDVAQAERHERLLESVRETLAFGHRWIGLGGGHDYGYPDGAGFLLANAKGKAKPLVINFDAHLDVRPVDQGISSGTPFYRLLSDQRLPPFDFIEIGVQAHCNSLSHLTWARERGAKIITFEDMMMAGQHQTQYLMEQLSSYLLKPRPTYLSIDIDGFSSAFAMGCSQSWATGFTPNEIFPFLNNLYRLLDVQILGIYEVSPPLDEDNRTVKLAAQIIHQFIGPCS